MLTGIKDLDYKILNELDDKSLVRFCETNKEANKYCDNQDYWRNRTFSRFSNVPPEILIEYKGERSWSDYYIFDLKRLNADDVEDLEYSLIKGRLDYVIILLNKGMKINDMIYYSVISGNLKLVKYLLNRGIKQSPKAILEAIYRGDLNMIKLLIEYGADVNSGNGAPLFRASKYGDLDVVKYLVEHGANVSLDLAATTAYHLGKEDIANYLISKGANVPSRGIF